MINKLSFINERKEMQYMVKMMYDRKMTNAAGGNAAVLVDENTILMTPSMMSEYNHCDLNIEDFLLVDFEQNILEGEGKLSREALIHIKLIKSFNFINAVIHAHPQYCMVYASQSKPIPSVTDATYKKGDCGVIPHGAAYSEDLADKIYEYFKNKGELAENMPLGVIMPGHGVVCTGGSLNTAYCMLERLETDAMCGILKNFI